MVSADTADELTVEAPQQGAPPQQPVEPPVQSASTHLYQKLIGEGYTPQNLGSLDEFSKNVSNPIGANKLYSVLRSDGYTEDNLGSLKEFQIRLAPIQKKSSDGNALPPVQNGSGLQSTAPLNGYGSFGNGLLPSQNTPSANPFTNLATSPQAAQQLQAMQPNQVQQPPAVTSTPAVQNYWKSLTPDEQKALSTSSQQITQEEGNDSIKSTPLSQQGDYAYSQTIPGKIQNGLTYLAQKVTKGGLQTIKGAAYLAQLGANAQSGLGLTDTHDTDKLFDSADKATDFLSKGSEMRVEQNSAMANIGGLAELAAPLATAASTGGATLYLQGMGQAKENIDNIEKSGAKVDPMVKNGFILGSGLVNGFLMGEAGSSIFKSLGTGLKNDVVGQITANAIKEAAGKELTAQGFNDLLQQGAKEWQDKALQFGTNYLEKTQHAITNLAALNVSNFAIKKAADVGNVAAGSEPIFNEGGDQLAEGIGSAIKLGGIFGAAGQIGEVGKLTQFSEYKNAVVDNLINDSSDQNIAKTKDFITQQGQQHGWTPDEIQATNAQVDELANVTKSLPKGLSPDKTNRAIDLVIGRNDLQKQLSEEIKTRNSLTSPFNEQPSAAEQLITDKIAQANDKLLDIANGTKTTYSKERDEKTGEETGNFLKTTWTKDKDTSGKTEEITQSRYDLEKTERDAAAAKNSSENAEPLLGQPQEYAPGGAAVAGEKPDEQIGDTKQSELEKIPEIKSWMDWVDETLANKGGDKSASQIEQAKKYKDNMLGLFTDINKQDKEYLDQHPNDVIGMKSFEKSKNLLDKFQAIEDKYKPDEEPESKTPTDIGAVSESDKTEVRKEIDGSSPLHQIEIPNDSEIPNTTQPIKEESIDAISKQEPGKMGLRDATAIREGVGGQNEPKEPATESKSTNSGSENAQPKEKVIDEKRQKAIDLISHGLITVSGENDGYSPRLDLDMSANDKKKAVADIHKGKYETTPAKRLIKKVMDFHESGDYPVIKGSGGHASRGKSITSEEMENGLKDARKYKLDNLPTKEELAHYNGTIADLGITHEDLKAAQDYENERYVNKEANPGTDNSVPKNVQRSTDAGTGNDSKSTGGETGKGEPLKAEVKAKYLTDEEEKERLELRKKFAGTFRTGIPGKELFDKDFYRYASLIFKEAKGEFNEFARTLIDEVGAKIKDSLAHLWEKSGGDVKDIPDEYKNEGAPVETGDADKKEPIEEPKSEVKDGDIKKTILTKRAYEGDIQPDVKKYLEDKVLTRTSFSQEERSKQATDFIKKFGDAAALRAVEAGDIKGGMAASILAQLQIKNSQAMADLPIGSDERDELAKKQADIIAVAENHGYWSGEFIGQLAHEYQNAELNYANVKKSVERLTKKPLTTDQEKMVKKLTDDNEKLKTKLKETEAKLIDETDKALNEPDKPAKPEKPKTEYAKKALDAIVKVRAKIKANSYSDATGMVALVDSGLATIEGAIRTGMTVTKAIEKGIDYIKTELKKRGIDKWEKEVDFRNDVTDAFAAEGVADTKKVRDENDLQQANIKRLEKELEDAKNNRLKKAPEKREQSDEEKDLHQQIKDEKLRISAENLSEAFVDKKDNKFSPEQARDIWGYMKGKYLENGVPYRDALSKTAQDLGLTWRQTSEAITTPKNRRASDEMWKQQSINIRNNNSIKNWIADQNKSGVYKAWKKVSGLIRGVAVFAHGQIFIGTHAGMTLFDPATLPKTIKAYLNGWKLAYGSEANYQRAVEELKNSPNYLLAQRAGLKNDPERINNEEYQNSQKYLGKLGLVGEHGFNAIKILRQDLFDHEFNKLSPAERDDPEVAKSIAQLMNLATGATNAKISETANEVFFAAGMEASRWEKLLISPTKALATASKAVFSPETASTADRVFAKVWLRRAGTQVATLTAALIANAALQKQINPKNPVNLTDPDKPDFMKFKTGDITYDPTSGMRSTAAFIYKLGKVGLEDQKKLHGDKRDAVLGKDAANYLAGKLAPAYGTLMEQFNRRDFNNNVLPWSNEKPASYAHKLTTAEYASQKLMLPVAEGFSTFYQSAHEKGVHKKTLNNVLKAIFSGAFSGATGVRVGEFDANSKENKKKK